MQLHAQAASPTSAPPDHALLQHHSILRWVLMLTLVVVAACQENPLDPIDTGMEPDVVLRTSFAASAGPGDRVALSLGAVRRGEIGGLEGYLEWDPAIVRLASQRPDLPGVALVRLERPGRARVVAADGRGLGPDAVALAFEVLDGAGSPFFAFLPRVVADLTGAPLPGFQRVDAIEGTNLPSVDGDAVPTTEEWYELVTPLSAGTDTPQRVPGEADLFGDGNVDGLVNVSDVVYVANIAVNNFALAECIVGTDAPARDCVAVNVFPENPPGLGGIGDDCAPGVDVCGAVRRTVNVSDVVPIASEAVGVDQAVVGEAVPKAPPASDTVPLAGQITGVRTLTSDTVYRLAGTVTVGDEAGVSGELVVEAGTRILGTAAATLVISRNGRIIADGTAARPVVFACADFDGPDCWHGLVINGNAPVNTGSATSPALGSRATGGCLEVSGTFGAFGGCEPADSSGVLRYVSVENGGRSDGAGLVLRGVGSSTRLEQIYASRSGVGVDVRGGTARMKFVRVTGPARHGVRWSDGWVGKLQFLAVQSGNATLSALLGTNHPATPDALPRSAPEIRNATVVGPPRPGVASLGSAGVEFRDGGAGTIRSSIFRALPKEESHVLDIDGVSSWAAFANGEVRVDSSIVAGFGRLGSTDPDEPVAGFVSPGIEDQFLRDSIQFNRVVDVFAEVDSVLRAPFATVPDLRPEPAGSFAGLFCPSASGDPFFEAVTYCGAIEPPVGTLGAIPWLEPAPRRFDSTAEPISPQLALQRYVVNSPQRGPLLGVTISGPTLGVTARDGTYRSYVTPDTSFIVTLGNVPSGCQAPDGTNVIVLTPLAPGQVRTNGIDIVCDPL